MGARRRAARLQLELVQQVAVRGPEEVPRAHHVELEVAHAEAGRDETGCLPERLPDPFQDRPRHEVAALRRLEHERREDLDLGRADPRILPAEPLEQRGDRLGAEVLAQHLGQSGGGAAPRVLVGHGAHGQLRHVELIAEVAEDRSLPQRTELLTGRVPAGGDGPCAGDHDDAPRLDRAGAERHEGVVQDPAGPAEPQRPDRTEEPIDVRRPIHTREAEHRGLDRSARDARVGERAVGGFGDRVTSDVDAGQLPVRRARRCGTEQRAERIGNHRVGLASAPVDTQDGGHPS